MCYKWFGCVCVCISAFDLFLYYCAYDYNYLRYRQNFQSDAWKLDNQNKAKHKRERDKKTDYREREREKTVEATKISLPTWFQFKFWLILKFSTNVNQIDKQQNSCVACNIENISQTNSDKFILSLESVKQKANWLTLLAQSLYEKKLVWNVIK